MQTLDHTHFIYRFRVNPQNAIAFQTWAQERGMIFWGQLPGVIRYRTFRQDRGGARMCQSLAGQTSPIDVVSQVEVVDRQTLDDIIASSEFQYIQNELLDFVLQDSLEYAILNCAYDSALN
jgi:hypothetical protein